MLAALAGSLFSQDEQEQEHVQEQEQEQRSSIPTELLRPQRSESPRYPVDTVIGALGQGDAPNEAYAVARRAAAALLSASVDAPVFAPVNRVFLEDCMAKLNEVSPLFFRLGAGRIEPDGAVSFLVRFVGRDFAITGELFVRLVERRQPAAEQEPEPAADAAAVTNEADEENEAYEINEEGESPQYTENAGQEESAGEEIAEAPPPALPPPPPPRPIERFWLFEDLILEDPRNREEETRESRQRYDFPPYERLF